MFLILSFSILMILNYSQSTVVKWIPNMNFNLPSNFKDNKLPCSNQTVIFPDKLSSAVIIEGDKSLSGMTLPNDGTIFLPRDGVITLEKDGSADGCKGGDAYYQDVLEWWWAQPDVWSSPDFNEATPDAERIPCYDDIAEFPKEAQFTVWLPDTIQHVRGLRINDNNVNQYQFESNVRYGRFNPNQLFALNTDQETGIVIAEKQCYTKSGCPCQDNPLQIICTKKACKKIECLNPVKPVGHCCNICGGTLTFRTNDAFDIAEFRDLVEKYVEENGGRDRLAYHVGKLNDQRIQLVVTEKTQYESRSSVVVSAVDAHLRQQWLITSKEKSVSGIPLSMTGLAGTTALGTLVVVVLIVIGLYLVYYKRIPLPQYPIMRPWRSGGTNIGMVSRFQGRTESVVSLTRRESPPPYGDAAAQGSTAFRNPLYESTREPGRRMQQIEELAPVDIS